MGTNQTLKFNNKEDLLFWVKAQENKGTLVELDEDSQTITLHNEWLSETVTYNY